LLVRTKKYRRNVANPMCPWRVGLGRAQNKKSFLGPGS